MVDGGRIDRDGAVVAAHAGFGSTFYLAKKCLSQKSLLPSLYLRSRSLNTVVR